MPELPEVETVRRGLEKHLVGRTICDIRVIVPKMIKGTLTDPELFRERILGSKAQAVNRRGKHLIISLNSGYYLLFHLNMRGQFIVAPRDAPDEKYLAAGFALDDGQELRFHDMWRWGEMRLVTKEELDGHPALSAMGPEPLLDSWSPQDLRLGLAKHPKTAIKAVLLDQAVLAGLGNIYADESLFRAAIQPLRRAGSLTAAEVDCLHREIRAVLTEATEDGGTVSDNYVDTEGRAGRYTPRVYDRGGEPCNICSAALTRIRVSGRGTVYCAFCQR